ncbi:MAG TPA: hypothetical protein VL132_05020 [Planctomycetaceae bacterium]|nr:hypothetical protein [Planctomycetaceae bacterium]
MAAKFERFTKGIQNFRQTTRNRPAANPYLSGDFLLWHAVEPVARHEILILIGESRDSPSQQFQPPHVIGRSVLNRFLVEAKRRHAPLATATSNVVNDSLLQGTPRESGVDVPGGRQWSPRKSDNSVCENVVLIGFASHAMLSQPVCERISRVGNHAPSLTEVG